MPHIWWWECLKVPERANLNSFPFKATKCSKFKRKAKCALMSLSEVLEEL